MTVRDRPKDFPDDDDVTVVSAPSVTYAVRCVPGLRAGPIHSLRVANHELQSDGPLSLSLGSRRYDLRLRSVREDLADAAVVLTDGRTTQVLYSAADGFTDEPHYIIEWARRRLHADKLVGDVALFETAD
jgi:hypothetical protein